MAWIEIRVTAQRPDDIGVFPKNGHIEFTIVDDFMLR